MNIKKTGQNDCLEYKLDSEGNVVMRFNPTKVIKKTDAGNESIANCHWNKLELGSKVYDYKIKLVIVRVKKKSKKSSAKPKTSKRLEF